MRLKKLGAILMDTYVYPYMKPRRANIKLYELSYACYGDPEIVLRAIDIGRREDLDVLIAPEWALMKCPRRTSAYTQNGAQKIINRLLKHSKGSDMLIFPGTIVYSSPYGSRNLLPVIKNGELIYTYHKRTDGGTSNFDAKSRFIQGQETGVFEHDGNRIGVEICADSGQLVQRRLWTGELDMQFFIAAGATRTESALRKGGLFFYANGGEDAGVYKPAYKESSGMFGSKNFIYTDDQMQTPTDSFPLNRCADFVKTGPDAERYDDSGRKYRVCNNHNARLNIYEIPREEKGR